MSDLNEQLRECAHCGGTNLQIDVQGQPGDYVMCGDPEREGCGVMVSRVDCECDPREAWNRRAPAAAPAPVAASELPPLPTFMRAHIERAINEAEQTRGFGVHDGMARLNVGYLKRIYGLADAAAQLHAAAAAPIVQPDDRLDDVLRDMLTIQEACGLHTDEYAPGSVIEYIKELEAAAAPTANTADAKDAARVKALHVAVSALYFDDSSDFKWSLGAVIRHLDMELASEFFASPKAAYDKSSAALAAIDSSADEVKP